MDSLEIGNSTMWRGGPWDAAMGHLVYPMCHVTA